MKDYMAAPVGQPMAYENVRPVYVVDSFDELTGPTHGVVQLPHYMDWSPRKGRFDLNCEDDVLALYAAVLSYASSESDVKTYLARDVLTTLWPTLPLPKHVRFVWEKYHWELSRAAF
jgi:hypothetical protein